MTIDENMQHLNIAEIALLCSTGSTASASIAINTDIIELLLSIIR